MENKKITLELSNRQYLDLLKMVFLGSVVAEEVIEDEESLASMLASQQAFYAASGPGKGNMYVGYDRKEDEYFMAEDIEDDLMEVLNQYDEARFWESLVMRLTLRDLQKKYSEKELRDMPEEKGTREMENIHNYYINEFDDHDLDNLKVISMKKV